MAIKIQNSTIIDDSRNIINAGVVTASSFVGNLTGTATTATNLTGGVIDNVVKANIAGVITATSFSGSGSGLTNVPASQLTGSLPAIDGSALIGVVATGTGVQIRDDGVTVGTAGTIDFGSNLTVSFSSGIATVSAGVVTYANSAGIIYATSAGIATYATNAGISTYATSAGIATYATSAGIATYADNAGIATYATNAGVSTYATSAGIATYADNAGIATYATSAGIATALQNARTFEITGDIVASPISFDGTGNVSLAATIQPNSVGLGTDTTGNYVQSISGTLNEITVTSGTGESSTPTLSLPTNLVAPQDLTVTRDLQVNRNLNVTGNITIGGTSAFIYATELRVSDPDIVLGYRTDVLGNDVSNDNTANHGGIAIASTEGNPLVNLFISGIETNPATYKKIMWFKEGTFAGLGTDAWLSNYAIGIGSTQFPTGTRLSVGNVQFTQNDLTVVRNISASGVVTSTNGFVGNLTGTATTATNLSNAANITTGTINSSRLSGTYNIDISGNAATATNAGVSTYATNAGITTYADNAGIATYANVAGIATYADNAGIATYATNAGIATYAISAGVATDVIGGIASVTSLNVTGISTLGVTSATKLTAQSVNSSGIVTGSSFRPSSSYYQSANGTNAFYVYDGTGNVAFQGTIGASQVNNASGFKVIGFAGTDITFENNAYVAGVTTSVGGFVGNLTGTATTATNLSNAANITTGTINSARLTGTYNIDISGNAATATNAGIATYASSSGIATYATSAGIATYATSAGIATYATNAGIATYSNVSGIATYATSAGIATYATNAGIATYSNVSGIATYATSAGIATYATNAGIATYSNVAGIATYADNAGIATYANVAGIATYADNAGIATYATNAGIATYADNAGIATYADNAGIATNLKGGVAGNIPYQSSADTTTFVSNGSANQVLLFDGSIPVWGNVSSAAGAFGGITVQDEGNTIGTASSITTLNFVGNIVSAQSSSGIATITFLNYISNAGVSTYATSAGIATYAQTAGIATYATSAGVATALQNARTFEITGDIVASPISFDGTGNVSLAATIQPNSVGLGTDTTGNYVASITNGSYVTGADGGSESALLTIGVAATSLNTSNQIVARDSSGNFSATTITANLTGTATTATNLSDAANITTGTINSSRLSGTYNIDISGNSVTSDSADTATSLQNARTFEITGDIVASPISFDGTGNVSLAATIQPNSVALGSDTTGDYVQTISGTSNQITVTGGTGESSTPTLSLPNNLVVPQDLTVTRDLQVNRNLNVTGNITLGGTTAFINVQELVVSDPDLVLGYRTDVLGNDASNDNTANHGGIAVASTEGSPLVQLFIAGIETNPATYKKIMWFKEGTFAGLGTDAWLINYAVGIGSTQFPNGTRLAAGNVQFTENDLAVVRNINASGIITAPQFIGTASTASFATTAFSLNGVSESNLNVAYASNSGIATYATNAGISTNLKGGVAGNVPYQSSTNTTTFVSNGTPGQVLIFDGNVPTWGNVSESAGVFEGISVYDENTLVGSAGSISTLKFVGSNLSVIATTSANGIATITMADNLVGTALSISGISTFGGNVSVGSGITMYASTGIISATAFYGSGFNLTDLVLARIEGIGISEENTAVGAGRSFTSLNFVGDYVTATGVGTTANITFTTPSFATVSGTSTSVIGGIASVTSLSVTGLSTVGNLRITPVGSGVTVGQSGIVTYYGDGSQLSGISAGLTIKDDTSTDATWYVGILSTTTGIAQTAHVSTTKLTFNPSTGNLVAGGTVTANSDEKLKTNIKTIENALDKVLSLRGVEFDRIDNGDHQIGVIAQEVQKIIPDVVYPKSSPDYETKSVAYGNLIGLLIEAIKEQNQKIVELERKLEEK